MTRSLTTAVRQRYGVPDSLELRADRREILCWLPGYEVAVRAVAARADDLPRDRRRGRNRLRRIERVDDTVLVREFGKGGMLRKIRGRSFHGRWRPLDELVLHRRLQALRVPVLDAVGAVVLRGFAGWRGYLLTREVVDATDMEAVLYGDPYAAGVSRHTALERAGRSVRMLHDAGVSHADLHPKNLLLTVDGEVLVLDLDRAVAYDEPLTEEARCSNLVRLGRAIEKHRMRGMPSGRREALRFLTGYAGSREAAGAWLATVRSELARTLGIRMVWWRLIGEARSRREGRDA